MINQMVKLTDAMSGDATYINSNVLLVSIIPLRDSKTDKRFSRVAMIVEGEKLYTDVIETTSEVYAAFKKGGESMIADISKTIQDAEKLMSRMKIQQSNQETTPEFVDYSKVDRSKMDDNGQDQ